MSVKNLIIFFVISLIIFSIGIVLLFNARSATASLAEVKQIRPLTSPAFQATAASHPVVLIGRIDPQGPVIEGTDNVAMAYETVYAPNTSSQWKVGRTLTPPFSLLIDSTVVKINNQDYRLEQRSYTYNEKGKFTRGSRRYDGFKRGDTVLVYGVKAGTEIEAKTVFGGSYAQFVRFLEVNSAKTSTFGWAFLGSGTLMLVVWIGIFALTSRNWRTPASGVYGGSYAQPPQGPSHLPSEPTRPIRR